MCALFFSKERFISACGKVDVVICLLVYLWTHKIDLWCSCRHHFPWLEWFEILDEVNSSPFKTQIKIFRLSKTETSLDYYDSCASGNGVKGYFDMFWLYISRLCWGWSLVCIPNLAFFFYMFIYISCCTRDDLCDSVWSWWEKHHDVSWIYCL